MPKKARRFVDGPLNGHRRSVEEEINIFKHTTPEGVHYYTLQKMKVLGSTDRIVFFYEGYKEPQHDPATQLLVPELPRRKRIQIRKPLGNKARPTTVNAKEVAARYLKVMRKLLRQRRSLVSRNGRLADLVKAHVLKEEENELADTKLLDAYKGDVHVARMAVIELECLLRDVTQYEPVEPTALEFAEYLNCGKDYLQWKHDLQHGKRMEAHFADEFDDANTEDDDGDLEADWDEEEERAFDGFGR